MAYNWKIQSTFLYEFQFWITMVCIILLDFPTKSDYWWIWERWKKYCHQVLMKKKFQRTHIWYLPGFEPRPPAWQASTLPLSYAVKNTCFPTLKKIAENRVCGRLRKSYWLGIKARVSGVILLPTTHWSLLVIVWKLTSKFPKLESCYYWEIM